MRKLIVALGTTTAVCLSSAAVALADGAPPPVQAVTQSATTGQQAAALSTAQQYNPQNVNVSIRINSPGDNGDVTQTNSADSSANAGNIAGTSQSAGQPAPSGPPSWWPVSNVPTRGPLPTTADGSSGSQSNDAGSTGDAGNAAATQQSAPQSTPQSAPPSTPQSTSCGCGGSNGGVQSADQSANTQQSAIAASKAVQVDPSNQNVSIRINSPGDDGSVTQTNSVNSTANAGNAAWTQQQSSQGSAGHSCGCETAPVSPVTGHSCGCDTAPVSPVSQDPSADTQPSVSTQPESSDPATGSAVAPASSSVPNVQAIQQDATTSQTAIAGSAAVQSGASNANDPVRINSKGDGGDVTQSNTVSSTANAGNAAWTKQNATQTSGGSPCGCGGSTIQAAGQKADTSQGALALSGAIQQFGGEPSRCGCGGSDGGAGNTSSPVRVWSPGTDGNLTQANTVDSTANAGNKAGTVQNASQQSGGGSGLQVQALGQWAGTWQAAAAGSLAAQFGASNTASPVRVWSPGGGGSVDQTNSASSTANAGNKAGTFQNANQTLGGKGGCGCYSLPIQALGQKADLDQFGLAGSAAFQIEPKNAESPARIGSWGDGGTVGQQNTDDSNANGGNFGFTHQFGSQLT